MKAVTEFANVSLKKALETKAALAADGKTAEEIQTSLGEAFKLEGEKLTYFVNALEVAGQNSDGLKRILVVSLAEGEKAPPKATQVEEMHYLPEFYASGPLNTSHKIASKDDRKGGRGGGRGGRGQDNKKSSPWGESPEEKAAKLSKPVPKTTS